MPNVQVYINNKLVPTTNCAGETFKLEKNVHKPYRLVLTVDGKQVYRKTLLDVLKELTDSSSNYLDAVSTAKTLHFLASVLLESYPDIDLEGFELFRHSHPLWSNNGLIVYGKLNNRLVGAVTCFRTEYTSLGKNRYVTLYIAPPVMGIIEPFEWGWTVIHERAATVIQILNQKDMSKLAGQSVWDIETQAVHNELITLKDVAPDLVRPALKVVYHTTVGQSRYSNLYEFLKQPVLFKVRGQKYKYNELVSIPYLAVREMDATEILPLEPFELKNRYLVKMSETLPASRNMVVEAELWSNNNSWFVHVIPHVTCKYAPAVIATWCEYNWLGKYRLWFFDTEHTSAGFFVPTRPSRKDERIQDMLAGILKGKKTSREKQVVMRAVGEFIRKTHLFNAFGTVALSHLNVLKHELIEP